MLLLILNWDICSTGQYNFNRQEPPAMTITRNYIQVYDALKWNQKDIFPVEYQTTKAKNTLYLIRQLLGLECDTNFALKNFFLSQSKTIDQNGCFIDEPFNLERQVKKLEYFLQSPELALELIKDADLDF